MYNKISTSLLIHYKINKRKRARPSNTILHREDMKENVGQQTKGGFFKVLFNKINQNISESFIKELNKYKQIKIYINPIKWILKSQFNYIIEENEQKQYERKHKNNINKHRRRII